MSSEYIAKQKQIPMIYRRHGDTTPKTKGHTLGNTIPSSVVIREMQANKQDAISSPSLPSEIVASTEPFVPSFLKADKKVLRFDAFFLEAVHESELENYRVRKCQIFYYLEDHTMQIVEPKTENSGLPQGNFIKRHRIPRPSTSPSLPLSYYTFHHLNIGINVTCYGRTFHICKADAFTRAYLTSEGLVVPEEEEDLPEDAFAIKSKSKKGAVEQSDKVPNFGKKQNSMKVFMEASLGKFTRPSDHLKRFLDHDRHVLRWDAMWDDSARLYGLKHHYTLHYFLADNTIEIREVFPRNSGCLQYPKLLNRTHLHRDPAKQSLESPHARGDTKDDEDTKTPQELMAAFISWQDLRIGQHLHVYGRELLLLDVDASTREWYAQHGLGLNPPLNVDPDVPERPPFIPPPHNGIGSEEDSLASCFSLNPKPTKTQVVDSALAKQLLRFSAHMDTRTPEDLGRRFIITYYLADKSIGVMEPPVRNSGIVGGKFLEKARHRNFATKALFEKQEFYLGARLSLGGSFFVLDGVDEYTIKFMEHHTQDFPKSDFAHILSTLRQLASSSSNAQAFHQALASVGPSVSFAALDTTLSMFLPALTKHEVNTIMRHYGKGDGESLNVEVLAQDVTLDSTESAVVSADWTTKVQTHASEVLQGMRLMDGRCGGQLSRAEFIQALRKGQFLSEVDIQSIMSSVSSSSSENQLIHYEHWMQQQQQQQQTLS